MSGISAVIQQLVMAAVLNHKTALPRKSKMDWAFMALSILLGCAGLFLSILALERFFEARYPLDRAALFSAGIVLMMSLLMAGAGYCCRRRKAPVAAMGDHGALEKNLHALLEGICGEIESPVRENPKTAVLIAVIAGFIAAQRRT